MDLELRGKRTFVSGSSSGLGKAIALELAAEGCDVVVHGCDAERSEATAREVADKGAQTSATFGDLSEEKVTDRVAAETLDFLGTVEILVDNCGAGLQMNNPSSADVPPEEWVCSYRANFIAGLQLAQRFAPGMKAQGSGRIVNISSTGGSNNAGFMPDYAAPKAAVNNFTGNLSEALGAHGITVNAVILGTILTPAVDRWLDDLRRQLNWGGDFAENECIYTSQITPQSLPRLGRPREIADAATFLASPLAAYINGAGLRVDGGSAQFF